MVNRANANNKVNSLKRKMQNHSLKLKTGLSGAVEKVEIASSLRSSQ
jgi:hypothetical protein